MTDALRADLRERTENLKALCVELYACAATPMATLAAAERGIESLARDLEDAESEIDGAMLALRAANSRLAAQAPVVAAALAWREYFAGTFTDEPEQRLAAAVDAMPKEGK